MCRVQHGVPFFEKTVMILGELPIKIMMKQRSIKKDDTRVLIRLWLLLALWLTWPIFAQSEQEDIREQCRRELSGIFLTAHNDVDSLRGHVKANSEHIRRLRIRHGSLLAEWETKKLKAKLHKYDRSIEEQVIAAENAAKQVHAEWTQAEELLKGYQKQLKVTEERLQKLTPIMEKLFKKVYPEDLRQSKGYRFTLAYKESCSKYQYLCPLSAQGRRYLHDISAHLGDIQACDRYAQMQIEP
ncbi:MAG: hypothetical protein ACOH5I_03350 [Oligoflexus sp.]